MKIISKYKDYYDYLQGIYGIDEKIVLDRTKADIINLLYYKPIDHVSILTLYICDLKITGFIDNKSIIYMGEDILKLKPIELKSWQKWDSNNTHRIGNYKFSLFPIKTTMNKKYNCPILIKTYYDNDVFLFPKLSLFNIQKVFDADTIYKMIYNWISETKNIPITNKQTDSEKIVSHGFDKKTSFRKM